MNSYIRIAATVFPRDMVCRRNISVDALHKGDIGDNDYGDDDNNNNNNKCLPALQIVCNRIMY
jgi:hypothetical protein